MFRSSYTNLPREGQAPLQLQKGLNEIHYFIGDPSLRKMESRSLPDTVDIYVCDTMGNRAQGVQFARDESELGAWARRYKEKFATLSDTQVYIKAVPGRMAYNLTSFTVKAGAKMKLIFENPDYMQHNLVLVSPGHADTVGILADELATRPDGFAKAYIPDSEHVLLATPLVDPGQKVELEFTVPREPGTYPVLCTFPGHWRTMRSIMIVEL